MDPDAAAGFPDAGADFEELEPQSVDLGGFQDRALKVAAQQPKRAVGGGVGQRLTVDLKLPGGYQVVAPEFNAEILALVGQSLHSSFGPQGKTARVVYEFIVRQAGQTDLVVAVNDAGKKPGQPRKLLQVKIMATGGGQII